MKFTLHHDCILYGLTKNEHGHKVSPWAHQCDHLGHCKIGFLYYAKRTRILALFSPEINDAGWSSTRSDNAIRTSAEILPMSDPPAAVTMHSRAEGLRRTTSELKDLRATTDEADGASKTSLEPCTQMACNPCPCESTLTQQSNTRVHRSTLPSSARSVCAQYLSYCC